MSDYLTLFSILKNKHLIYLGLCSGIVLFLIFLLLGLAYFKVEPAIAVSETIVGVIVAYAIFVYEWFIAYVFSFKKIQALQSFRRSSGWKNRIKYIAIRSILILIRTAPILLILLLISFDFSIVKVNIETLREVLGGITGAWALGIFLYILRFERADKTQTFNNHIDAAETNFIDLYNQTEYVNRNALQDSEYFMLAHLTPNQFVHIAIPNQSTNQLPQITAQDSQKVIKLKSDLYQDSTERWYKGFVPMRRRVQGHLLFAAGAEFSISLIMFDRSSYMHKDILDPFFTSDLPVFDDVLPNEIISNIHNAPDIANKTLALGDIDILLDKAIIFSGEAIRAWFIPELSFFSAWRSIETMAKREFRNDELAKGTAYADIQNLWIYGKNISGSRTESGLKRRYIEKILNNKNIPFKGSDLDTYQDLRNYIGHGSVDIDSEQNMEIMEHKKFADISSKTIDVIKLSRKLIKDYLQLSS